jgi:transposase-like protein
MAKKKPTKRTAGRPKKPVYDPEFCDMLIEHMGNGFSFASFAPAINVARSTLYEWVDKYEDFAYSKELAEDKCLLFWEARGIDIVLGARTNGSVYIFNMANRFHKDWKLNRDNYELQEKQKEQENNALDEFVMTYDPMRLKKNGDDVDNDE